VPSPIPVFVVPSLRARLGAIAEAAYKTSASGMRLFAVTGTNGKTSTTTYIYRLLRELGIAAGMSASHLQISNDEYHYSPLTTPECLDLHRFLFELREAGQNVAAVEVSAHALDRNRVDGLLFEVAGFTNLARDHLDDFGTMENYRNAKLRLFARERAMRAVINVNNEHGQWMLANVSVPCESIGASGGWQIVATGDKFRLSHPNGIEFQRPFSLSRIAAENLAVALAMLHAAGFENTELQGALERLDLQIPGRLERFQLASEGVDVYLDYAHTPAAVEAAVAALSAYSNLTVIVGASGNRDQGKRPEMGFAAAAADRVVVTDQHPRLEDPAVIRESVRRGALLRLPRSEIYEEADPERALDLARRLTHPGGAILWCGPGDLDYREVGGQKIVFSARRLIEDRVKSD
jgi:UDP-N-acetylmuramoyl-L-alanyl-D-glutamate--2,6-diaminopimelate ligase